MDVPATELHNGGARRNHQTEKRWTHAADLRIATPGGVIFDSFTGSGATLLAASMEGYDSVGCELSDVICSMAVKRLRTGIRMKKL